MGLVRGVARTAAIAGTATAVSNRVSRRQARRWSGSEQAPQQAAPPPQYAAPPPQYAAPPPQYAAPPPQYAAPAPAPGGEPTGGISAEIQRLGDLKAQGLLTDDEFSAAKAKLLGL
jgi:hypothetical protein